MSDEVNLQEEPVAPVCSVGTNPSDAECCNLFLGEHRAEFGYDAPQASWLVHDICVEDVRAVGVKYQTIYHCVPCNIDGRPGCRGGFSPDGAPTVVSYRVYCAHESLSPQTGCDRINNTIEFEVVLRYGSTLVVVTPRDSFSIRYNEFSKFPTGGTFTLNEFQNLLTVIDGSCKVIVITGVTASPQGNDCVLRIDYKVVDKLWKHENLLVTGLKPYYGPAGEENITVTEQFNSGHGVGPCYGGTSCTGV